MAKLKIQMLFEDPDVNEAYQKFVKSKLGIDNAKGDTAFMIALKTREVLFNEYAYLRDKRLVSLGMLHESAMVAWNWRRGDNRSRRSLLA